MLGDKIVVGLVNALCVVFEFDEFEGKIRFFTKISCRNRWGLKRSGRKITGFDFLDNELFLISTNDSRLRLISLGDF